jgi:hypothetical protein
VISMKVLRDNLSVFLGLDSEGASSMKLALVTVLASLFLSAFPQATTGNDDNGWSSPVNGLQARLSVARGQALNGTPLITTYLELRNVADVANVMELPFNPGPMRFEVVDEQDKLLAQKGMVYDELSVELGMLRLPHDSYLRFDISHHGAGVPKNQAALLDLGIPYVWVFSPDDKHSYYLRGRFSIEARKDRTWSGTIEMPRVKIPIAN